MPMLKILFSLKGKISSWEYFKGIILSIPCGAIVFLIFAGLVRYLGFWGSLFLGLILISYIELCLAVKRLRDIGMSPWYAIILLMPGLQVILFWYLLAAPSSNVTSTEITPSPIKSPSTALETEKNKAKYSLIYFTIGVSVFVLFEPMIFLTLKLFFTIIFGGSKASEALLAIPLGFIAMFFIMTEHFLKIVGICLLLVVPGFIAWQAAYVTQNYTQAAINLKKIALLYIPIYILYIFLQGSIIFSLKEGNPFKFGPGKNTKPLTLTTPY